MGILTIALVAQAFVGVASAQPPAPASHSSDRVSWRAGAWHPFDVLDWLIIGSAAVSLITTTAIGPNLDMPRRGGVLFDDAVRDALVLRTEHGRLIARDVSDVFLTTAWGFPVLVDGFLVAGWYHDAPDLAREMVLMDAEVLAVTAAIQQLANVVSSRERPYGRRCGGELDEGSRDCDSSNRYDSFFSGHTSQSFAAAAATCMHHAEVPLYGGGFSDATPCIATMAVAVGAGTLRIVGDQHYATDVLAGAVIGTSIGLLLPYALHYGRSSSEPDASDDSDLSAHLFPTPQGVGVAGTF